MNRRSRRFTLVELLLAITIITILLSMVLPALQTAQKKARLTRWLVHSMQMRGDPDLVELYNFYYDDYGKDEVREYSLSTHFGELKNNAQWTPDSRFQPLKKGLLFNGSNAYVQVPDVALNKGYAQEFTLAVWLKAYSFGQWNTIRNTSGWDKGDLHVQFGRGGYLEWAVWPSSNDQWFTEYGPFETDKWYLIVCCYSREERYVKLYVNGEHEETKHFSYTPPAIHLEDAWIGAWKVYENGTLQQRPFHGVIDELVMMERVWTPDEVKYMYKVGKPF